MPSGYSFRNLVMWQKAQALTLEIIRLTSGLPRNAATDVIVRQIIRSSSSIAANIAEGHGRYAPRAHANHLLIARGSACETDSWLDLLQQMNVLEPQIEERLHSSVLELVAMLTSKARQLAETAPAKRVRDQEAEWLV